MIETVTSISPEPPDHRIGGILEWTTPSEARKEGFRTRFRSFMAEAMLRQAEADVALHVEQGHRVRSYLAARRVQQLRRETVDVPDTGDRVVMYLQRGAQNAGRAPFSG